MSAITLVDQDSFEAAPPVGSIPWADRVRITARELIAERAALAFEAGEPERAAPRGVAVDGDVEAVTARAVEAFRRGRFLLFAGGRQIESLDEVIAFQPGLQVAFVRLVPLAGG